MKTKQEKKSSQNAHLLVRFLLFLQLLHSPCLLALFGVLLSSEQLRGLRLLLRSVPGRLCVCVRVQQQKQQQERELERGAM